MHIVRCAEQILPQDCQTSTNWQANLVSHNSKILLAPFNVNDHIKEMDLQLALAIACHTSIMAVDQLGEIMVNHGKGSSRKHLKLYRTISAAY